MSSSASTEQFILSSIQFISSYGFSTPLLEHVEHKLELPRYYHLILFPGGLKEFVKLFEDMLDAKMQEAANTNPMPTKIRDKVQECIKLRLCSVQNAQEIFTRLVEFYKAPAHALLGIKNSWNTVDKIWRICNDDSTDFNYYTKRSLLLGAYRSTVKYFVKDKSAGYVQTFCHLEQYIQRIMAFSTVKKKIVDFVGGRLQ